MTLHLLTTFGKSTASLVAPYCASWGDDGCLTDAPTALIPFNTSCPICIYATPYVQATWLTLTPKMCPPPPSPGELHDQRHIHLICSDIHHTFVGVRLVFLIFKLQAAVPTTSSPSLTDSALPLFTKLD